MRIPQQYYSSDQPFDTVVEYDWPEGQLPDVFPSIPDGEGGHEWIQTAWPGATISVPDGVESEEVQA